MIPSRAMRHLLKVTRGICIISWPSAMVALAAWISILTCIDPAGSYPSRPQGPGLTIDEMFNVQQGVFLVENSRALGWLNLVPGTSVEAFRPKNGYNPDHPPLGRYWLGIHHHLAWWIAPPFDPDGPFVTACARTGSATAFALTVWLIGAFAAYVSLSQQTSTAASRERPPAAAAESPQAAMVRWQGLLASVALVLMPRVYGHAHLAALESITNLTCTAAVLVIAVLWSRLSAPSPRDAMLAGIVMGLALLTKIQAILIPIPVICWTLARWRGKAIVPLLVWGSTSLSVFFACWPYLWLDPIGHLLEYLGRTTHRATLHCFYFGVRYEDKAVPWHYPFVIFAVSIPLTLHILSLIGLSSQRRGPADDKPEETTARSPAAWTDRLVLWCSLFPLIVFALPGVAVYDGERLFLTAFPLWAIIAGRGAARIRMWASKRCGSHLATIAVGLLIVLQLSLNLMMSPSYLSYYNAAVGGIRGAEAWGFEMNYWGDAVNRELLARACRQQPVFDGITVVPSLHQFHNEELIRQSPLLRRHLRKTGSDSFAGASNPLRLAFRRRADLDDAIYRELSQTHGTTSPDLLGTFDGRVH